MVPPVSYGRYGRVMPAGRETSPVSPHRTTKPTARLPIQLRGPVAAHPRTTGAPQSMHAGGRAAGVRRNRHVLGMHPRSQCPDVRGVDHGFRPVQRGGCVELGEQNLVQALPHVGLVPVPQPPPARHPRTEAELLGQVLPAHPGMQDVQDPAQNLTVGYRPATRIPDRRSLLGTGGSIRSHSQTVFEISGR